jgi:uncharacterized protein YkwD
LHESCILYEVMKPIKNLVFSLFLLAFLFGGISSVASAEGVIPSPQDEALLVLINQARENPLQAAASLGMDPERILSDLPNLAKILQEGLPPLTWNENLAEAAHAHTGDMFAQSYYSHISPDGRDYDQRIKESGYPAAVSGESLGMILFANFINPEDAVRLIFEYMFQDELNPSRTEQRTILNPCLREAGISVNMGAMGLGGAQWNVYLATCDFGAVMSCPEGALFDLINLARENPLEMAASLGLDPDQVLAELPEWYDILTQGLPPLVFNLTLAKAARAHAADMLANGYYSHDSLDGRTLEDRIREAGYEPLDAGETLWLACLGHDDELLNEFFENDNEKVEPLIQKLFKNLFARELRPDDSEEKNIISSSLNEVGIGFAHGISPDLGGICGDRVLLLVMDFASSHETQHEAQ